MAAINPTNKPPIAHISNEQGENFNIFYSGDSVIYQQYLSEVVEHIRSDEKQIRSEFLQNKKITNIQVSVKGKETHYGGKVALLLDFTLQDGSQIKLIYKPRSIRADQIVEESVRTLYHAHPKRHMLDRGVYGYDTFVEGDPLDSIASIYINDKPNPPIVLEKLMDYHQPYALVATLWKLGIEDVHPENFIYNPATRILHFIDAECYQTGVSVTLQDLEEKFGLAHFSEDLQEQKQTLRSMPTRLVFCGSDRYTNYFTRSFISAEPVWFFEKSTRKQIAYYPTVEEPNTEKAFASYQNALFLRFLHVNGFVKLEEWSDEVSNQEIQKKLEDLIGEEGCAIPHRGIFKSTVIWARAGCNRSSQFPF